jgi:ubiquinone/menaquinone biosynthesis C-methylase UbiE
LPGSTSPTRPGQGEFDAVAQYYDHLMRTVPYAGWVDYVEAILRRWKARPSTVLDLACGTGKVGSEMLRRGYDVTGADLSEPMVQECTKQAPPLAAVVSDASQLALADESLNYLLEPEQFRGAMAEAHRVLRSNGLLVFDMNTIRALSTSMFTQASMTGPDPLHYDWHAYWDPWTRLCRVEMWFGYRTAEGTREFRETHYQRAYTSREIVAALEAAGFRRHKSYDAYRFTPVTPWTDRAYYVARKE